MSRSLFAVALLGLTLLSAGAAGAPQDSWQRAQACQTQACRDCVDRCDRELDDRMADCATQYPRPGENQEICFYFAMADHDSCLAFDCGV